ncbi:DUF3800 domain-containing protein [Ideonella sp. 4Y16]|uniref:DUF3800 domain-containing protein n=1 Tax=Ideonella alba TaxID=2824118 RepID=UPI001B397995|nr:DUF3800 domain-containing protein [Ideonella alba]MBQ0944111.1 DUF3800 domain-containing protein [Ideonella alba]
MNHFLFYVDDSGPKHPDHAPPTERRARDWFGLGGVLIREQDKASAEQAYDTFCSRWPELDGCPLHSVEIRHCSKAFRWLAHDAVKRERFLGELTDLINQMPIVVHACVIDRPGYNQRYQPVYGEKRWSLCKTAFTIAVERAAKFARAHDARLRVYVERTDRRTERRLKTYFDELRANGLPFNADRSAKYGPLEAGDLQKTLLEFGVKTKQSRLMQVADLVLWPMCMGGYDAGNRALASLRESGRLIDVHCTKENGLLGVKYSCFDGGTSQVAGEAPASA